MLCFSKPRMQYLRPLLISCIHKRQHLAHTLASTCSLGLLLLLVVHKLEVILGYLLVLFEQELLNLVAHVSLDNNLLTTRGGLCDAGTGSKLLAKLLCDFLKLEVECLEARHGCDKLALIALDALDDDGARGALVGLLLLGGLCLCRLFQSVFFGALLGFDRKVGC